MRHLLPMTAIAGALALAAPAHAQNMPQILQGMMTGNQNQDRAIREAYERGYQKGREDEAQMARARRDDRRPPPPPPYDARPNDPRYPDPRYNDPRQPDYRR